MGRFELDEEEQQLIYDALKGDINLSTLQKTKKMLEAQRLPHGVQEIQQKLRILEGTGEKNPGLLRIFNPQHDALADAEQRAAVAAHDDRQRDAFDGGAVGGVDDTPAAPSGVAIEWGDDVPSPRPESGALIVQPSGMSCSVVDVLGYDAEQEGFRVVDADGWDGYVFPYGQRDHVQWRVRSQALDYRDGSDLAEQPLGSLAVIAAELYERALVLLDTPGTLTAEVYHAQADELLPLLKLANPTLQPDYLTEHVYGELSGYEDNAQALGRFVAQCADVATAQAGEQPVDEGDEPGGETGPEDDNAETEHEAAEAAVASEGYAAGVEQGEDPVAAEAPKRGRKGSKQQERNASHNGVSKGKRGKKG